MATKVTSGKLNVQVTETVTVNGVEQTYTNVNSVAGVNTTFHRIIRVALSNHATAPTNFTLLASTAAAAAGGSFVAGEIKYIRITNQDDTNYVVLRLEDTGANQYYFRLAAGEIWTGYGAGFEANATAAATVDYTALRATADNIAAVANTAAVDVEVFIASTAA